MNNYLVKYNESDIFDSIDNEVIMQWFQKYKNS